MATSFEQFRASLTRPIARSALGIDMSDIEASRVSTDEALSRAYYENWLRTPRPDPTSSQMRVAASAARPAPATPPPVYLGAPAVVGAPVTQSKKSGAIWTILPIVFIILCVCAYLGYQASKPSTSSDSSSSSHSSTGSESNSTSASESTADKTPVLTVSEERDAAAASDGWMVLESGNVYAKAAEPGSFTCGYFTCLWYSVQSFSGCPGGVYLKADILSSGTAVGWTNAVSPSIKPGETVAVKLEDAQGIGDMFRISEANCN